jgi:hypothetical protein
MTGPRTALAIRILHWTVGLVILLESCRTLHGALLHGHDAGHGAALLWIRLVLSSVEIVAALLFLAPWAVIPGAYLLLAIIAVAVCIHALHGEFAGLELLILYAATVYICLVNQKEESRPRTPSRSVP